MAGWSDVGAKFDRVLGRSPEQVTAELGRDATVISRIADAKGLIEDAKAKRRTMKLTNLRAAGLELHKLVEETEDDAKKLIGEIEAARAHKNATFARAPAQIASIRQGVTEFGSALDELDEALGDNGGPTLDASSNSPSAGDGGGNG